MEKAIVCTAEEVRGFLEKRRTQIRRVIKPQPSSDWTYRPDMSNLIYAKFIDSNGDVRLAKKPYRGHGITTGKPGDVLRVRETWRESFVHSATEYEYKADPERETDYQTPFKWHSSTCMPRAAARLFLPVQRVWVERLQDITEEDARAEGISEYLSQFVSGDITEEQADIWRNRTSVENFASWWDSTNTKKGYPWNCNPWVWVVERERCSRGVN